MSKYTALVIKPGTMGVSVLTTSHQNFDGFKELKEMAESIQAKDPSGNTHFIILNEEKVEFLRKALISGT